MKKKTKVYALILIVIVLIIICRSILTFDSINYKLNVDGTKIKVNDGNTYIQIQPTEKTFTIE